ncbi:MAG: sulfatase-like hydrolase/transferase [Anaerolineaceae bacterium]|nr:sulfatase-like hydrolase/transferase [Anaerolineaceae bacterium]
MLSLLLAGCGVPSAGGPADTFYLDFEKANVEGANGAIVFFVDGLNASIFQEMLEAGQLPAMDKYFVQRGLYAPRAVANIPSVTLANETSVVTGLYSGHHGVTGINWFDRNRLVWRNYETIDQKNTLDGDYTATTLFEHFPERTTFSIFFQAHRGATKFVENWMSAGPPYFFGWYEFVDRLTLWRFNNVIEAAMTRHEFPALTVVYLLAPDFRAYDYGIKSENYRQALRQTDRQIGRVLGDLQRAGLLDKVYIALVSDHGFSEVTRHFYLESFLRKKIDLNLAHLRLWEDASFAKRLKAYRRYAAVMYGSGDRYGAICLRRPIRLDGQVTGLASWPIRPTPSDLADYPTRSGSVNLISVLIEQEAVDAVAYSVGRDAVRLVRKTGQVEFRQMAGRGGPVSCHLISGDDPLGWKGKVPQGMLDGSGHSPSAWLAATVGTEFPGLPAQIVAYFRARRAGDLVVFAAPGWDFQNSYRAGHGGLRPEDMFVPMLLAGPGVPQGRLDVAQTVDLAPTLLHLLGRPVPPGLDGRILVGEEAE